MTNAKPIDPKTLTGDHRCYRCQGTGTVEWAKHIANGRCFLCSGSGTVAAGQFAESRGVHHLQVGDIVWQFAQLNREGFKLTPTCKFATGMVLCFKYGSTRRAGTTLLRVRVSSIEIFRNLWRRARAGAHPDAITADEMGVKERSCAISRNVRGIEEL